jgi:hypothetical protein
LSVFSFVPSFNLLSFCFLLSLSLSLPFIEFSLHRECGRHVFIIWLSDVVNNRIEASPSFSTDMCVTRGHSQHVVTRHNELIRYCNTATCQLADDPSPKQHRLWPLTPLSTAGVSGTLPYRNTVKAVNSPPDDHSGLLRHAFLRAHIHLNSYTATLFNWAFVWRSKSYINKHTDLQTEEQAT